MHCGWGKGGDTRKRNTDNRKPEVRIAATLVLVRDGLVLEWCSGTERSIKMHGATVKKNCRSGTYSFKEMNIILAVMNFVFFFYDAVYCM
jgi:hypothetical protein